MKTYYELTSQQITAEPCVISMGFFDGVHRGHSFLLSQAREKACLRQARQVIITFASLPRIAGKQITTTFHRRALLEPFCDILIELDFAGIEFLSPLEFLTLLRQMFPCQEWVVGADFRFGAGRVGGISLLDQILPGKVTVVQPVVRDNLSSTHIRECITSGDIIQASQLLGRPYSLVFPLSGLLQETITLHTQSLCLPKETKVAPFVATERGRVAVKVSVEEGYFSLHLVEEVRSDHIEIFLIDSCVTSSKKGVMKL